MNPIKGIVWDLDGTLLDTLEDLTGSVNTALRQFGMPERTRQDVRAFLGNGAARLVALSVPVGTDKGTEQAVLEAFRADYALHNLDHTAPYPGILSLLGELQRRGVRQAIVSNKPDFAVAALRQRFFGDTVALSVGDTAGRPRKPSPDSTLEALRQMGVGREEALFVGDSEVDVETARRAGLTCLAVAWGFRDREQLEEAGAAHIAATAEEAAAFIRERL